MFKSSTAPIAALALGLALLLSGETVAQQAAAPPPGGNVVQLQPDAPDQYVVQPGDTLWSISGKFLQQPWRWPEIWRLNKDQIRNPHLIYPGNVVRLDRSGPYLSLVERLEPRVRAEPLGAEAIPSIPMKVIEPFLTQPLVVERDGLQGAPRIVATEEGRYNVGSSSRAYVTGIAGTKENAWQIYRSGTALIDPETNETLGYEAIYLGNARLLKQGDPATVQITSARQEVGDGDRLIVAPQAQVFSYVPRAPEKPIRGQIIGIYDGRTDVRSKLYSGGQPPQILPPIQLDEAGSLAVVSLNRGARHGLEVGHVLALSKSHIVKRDRSVGPWYLGEPRQPPIQLPEERYGLLMVFRVFDSVSYALTLNTQRQVSPGDVISQP